MCTTIAIGKKATLNGAVIIAHSDDDVSDERFVRVPANSCPGEYRPVYYDNAALGPMKVKQKGKYEGMLYNANELYRYIGSARGAAYELSETEKKEKGLYDSIPLGKIRQAESTFAYFDSSYGVMNEKQLMIGECTCGAKVHPEPSPDRIFYSAELSRVALERCEKAIEAVKLIGHLIMEHGYYGTGETLLIGDPEEAWVMEMCGYDMNGNDGLWVAQRVPDNGFFVAANQFRIRHIDTDSDQFLYSDTLHQVCKDLGWWDKEKSPMLDWAATVSYGEYCHPYYSLRRVWRALTKAKPSANLPAWVENGFSEAYPFCVIPDVKLDVAGVANIYRDHYEGTEFDLTQGHASGPWRNPTRYENNPDQGNAFELNVNSPTGAWERPLSIYRCGMFWINEAIKKPGDVNTNGLCWLGLERPATNCLMPLYCQIREVPKSIQTMNLVEFEFDSTWWAFNVVANYATLKYDYLVEEIRKVQANLEEEAFATVNNFHIEGFLPLDHLEKFCFETIEKVHESWWNLAKMLFVRYNDGCITTASEPMKKVDYPDSWLRKTNYYQGPVSYNKEECK